MDRNEIARRKTEFQQLHGPWTAHNIHLVDDVYTKDKDRWVDSRVKRSVQVVADIIRIPFRELRVLDLACLEGMFAVEFALQGARTVAIEGREANLDKARFVKDVHGLKNLDLYLDDVRNLSKEKYGSF